MDALAWLRYGVLVNWPAILVPLITTILTTALLTWLLRSAHRAPEIEDGVVVLRYPRAFRIGVLFAGVVLVGLAVLPVALILAGEGDDKLVRVTWFSTPLMLLLGVPCFFEGRVELRVDAEKIEGQTAFRGERSIRFEDIVDVRWSGALGWFKLTAKDGSCLRISRRERQSCGKDGQAEQNSSRCSQCDLRRHQRYSSHGRTRRAGRYVG